MYTHVSGNILDHLVVLHPSWAHRDLFALRLGMFDLLQLGVDVMQVVAHNLHCGLVDAREHLRFALNPFEFLDGLRSDNLELVIEIQVSQIVDHAEEAGLRVVFRDGLHLLDDAFGLRRDPRNEGRGEFCRLDRCVGSPRRAERETARKAQRYQRRANKRLAAN